VKNVLLVALLILPLPALGQMYKCVDERGRTTYSDKPGPNCKGGPVDIRPSPPISGEQTERREEDFKRQDAEFRRRQIERSQAEERERSEREKERAERKQYCDELQREYVDLDSARRIVTNVNAKGERTYMDDATRQKRLAQIREQLGSCQ
jgi:hypothetical protein